MRKFDRTNREQFMTLFAKGFDGDWEMTSGLCSAGRCWRWHSRRQKAFGVAKHDTKVLFHYMQPNSIPKPPGNPWPSENAFRCRKSPVIAATRSNAKFSSSIGRITSGLRYAHPYRALAHCVPHHLAPAHPAPTHTALAQSAHPLPRADHSTGSSGTD